jgi:hypothetical protein
MANTRRYFISRETRNARPSQTPVKGLIGIFCIPGFGAGMKTLVLLVLAALLASCATRSGCCSEGASGRQGGEMLGKAP